MHVALIMDGNRRWAKEQNMPSQKGHIAGVKKLEEIIHTAYKSDVTVLTLYCFSTENWQRTRTEVSYLMDLFAEYILKYQQKFCEYDIGFRHIGRRDRIPKRLLTAIQTVEKNTQDQSKLTLQFAIDYGGRDEILRAFNTALQEKKDFVREEDMSDLLDTREHCQVDLVIRTSGEQRLSNFLLWQVAYSELVFREEYFPDFGEKQFTECLNIFLQRKRRLGK